MVYNKRRIIDLHDNDGINSWEAGFMQGYLDEEE